MLTFPSLPGLAYPLKRSPQWSTAKLTALSGRESRIARWSYPVWQYVLPFEFLRSGSFGEYESFVGFFNAVGGSANPWLFSDPLANSVTAQGFGTGDGATTTFQLVRSLGGYAEPVLSISGVTITINGTATTAFSIGANGIVTFATAPAMGAALAWSGSYQMVCRFDEDTVAMSNTMSGFWEAKEVKFTSVKV